MYRVCEACLDKSVDDLPYREAVALARACFSRGGEMWFIDNLDVPFGFVEYDDSFKAALKFMIDKVRGNLDKISDHYTIPAKYAKHFQLRIEFRHELWGGRIGSKTKQTLLFNAGGDQ